jgi:hypothetical protein
MAGLHHDSQLAPYKSSALAPECPKEVAQPTISAIARPLPAKWQALVQHGGRDHCMRSVTVWPRIDRVSMGEVWAGGVKAALQSVPCLLAVMTLPVEPIL